MSSVEVFSHLLQLRHCFQSKDGPNSILLSPEIQQRITRGILWLDIAKGEKTKKHQKYWDTQVAAYFKINT